jgi:hypothetical protein
MQRLLNATRCTFLVNTEKVEMKECLEPTRGVKWVDLGG